MKFFVGKCKITAVFYFVCRQTVLVLIVVCQASVLLFFILFVGRLLVLFVVCQASVQQTVMLKCRPFYKVPQ